MGVPRRQSRSRVADFSQYSHRTRGIAPLVGVLGLLAITVVLSAVVVAGFSTASFGSNSVATVGVSLEVEAADERLIFTHQTGEPIDVEALSLTVAVDGEELTHQPPVPFFAATGFESGPTGPFNSRASGEWAVGERASFSLASTNSPSIESGDRVSVTLVVDEQVVTRLEERV